MEKTQPTTNVEENKTKLSLRKKISLAYKTITVEPVVIIFILPFALSALTIQNLNLEKACRVNLKLDAALCDAIKQRNKTGYNETDEIIVQKVVAASYIWKNVVFSLFPAMLLPFFGSWSDRNKTRKVLMLLPIIGEIITNIGFLICTFFFYELPMEVNIAIEAFPTALTGGSNMLLLGVFTYIATVSTTEDRTIRIGVAHILFTISMTAGNALSGIMYGLVGFYGVFSISLLLYTSGALYVYYYVKEKRVVRENCVTNMDLFKDIVNVKQTIGTFKFLFQPTQITRTKQVFVVVILAVFVLGPFIGEMTILYLYTRLTFSWDEIDFSIFYTYYSVAHLIGCLIALSLFTKVLKLDDAILGAISSISKICGGIVYMLAKTPVVFYIGTILEIFNSTAFIASRSIISKLVLEEELGKVNSIFGIAESLTGLIYGPMYSAIYKATIHTFSGAFFVVGACLTIPAILMYMWLYSQRHNRFIDKVEDCENKEVLLQHNVKT